MNDRERYAGRKGHLKRLPKEHYQGQAYVHWSMTMENRRTGWLIPILYYKFREILHPHRVPLWHLFSDLLLHAGSSASAVDWT